MCHYGAYEQCLHCFHIMHFNKQWLLSETSSSHGDHAVCLYRQPKKGTLQIKVRLRLKGSKHTKDKQERAIITGNEGMKQ